MVRALPTLPVLAAAMLCWVASGTQAQTQAPAPKTPAPKADRQRSEPAPAQPKPAKPATMPQPDGTQRGAAPVPMEAFAAEPGAAASSGKPEDRPDEPSACRIRIADKIAVIEPLPSFGGPGDCGATDVVKLEAIIQPDKSRVAVSPPATLRCTMAEAVANWVRDDLTESVAKLGAKPRTLDNYASYDCRGRNRIAGARMSQHGLANAIDVRGLHLTNGRFAEFTDRALDREFREAVRRSACARFTTVLGPGSDGHHESHIHVDLAERRGGYRLCQWNVLDPVAEIPLPRPRPKEAP